MVNIFCWIASGQALRGADHPSRDVGQSRFVPHGLAAKHDHFELVLADQMLRFADPRRFGVVVWQPGPPEDAERHPLLASQGIEPLSDAFTVDGGKFPAQRADQAGLDG